MSKSFLTFLNHACFLVEDETQILLIDPWIEGNAFFNGWALLDDSTKDEDLIKHLVNLKKSVNIWYSHEHSDHFSIPFLKKLQKSGLNITIVYQNTLDKRVASFIKTMRFDFLEAFDGIPLDLSPITSITTWKYMSGDSFSLIISDGVKILNINDCEIKNKSDLLFVKNKIKLKEPLHVLFTQFGYANFIGNEVDYNMRKAAAVDKLLELKLQANYFDANIILPFASFIYFCNNENFYLNDYQNTPASIRGSDLLSDLNEKIFFMKPFDKFAISSIGEMVSNLSILTKSAEDHWQNRFKEILPICGTNNYYDIDELSRCFGDYSKSINKFFLYLPRFLEFIGVIRPIYVLIIDLQIVVKLSYLSSNLLISKGDHWNISMSSEVLRFILVNDFGFNSVSVNGRFRLKDINKRLDIYKFFGPQDFKKNGFGVKYPLASLAMLLKVFLKLVKSMKKAF